MQIQCTVMYNLCHVNQKNILNERNYERRYVSNGSAYQKNLEGI